MISQNSSTKESEKTYCVRVIVAPDFSIGDYVRNTKIDKFEIGRITSFTFAELEIGDINTISVSYCYQTITSERQYMIGEIEEISAEYLEDAFPFIE